MSEVVFIFNLKCGHVKLSTEALQKNGGAQKEIDRVLQEAGITCGEVEIIDAQPATKQKQYKHKRVKDAT